MKTSLKKPIGIFVQFLKGLESENDNRRKSFRDAEGENEINVCSVAA